MGDALLMIEEVFTQKRSAWISIRHVLVDGSPLGGYAMRIFVDAAQRKFSGMNGLNTVLRP